MKNEVKTNRFKKVAEKRVQRILDGFRLLSNCSNRRMYEWNDEQIKKMWRAIEAEYKACKMSFEDHSQVQFKL